MQAPIRSYKKIINIVEASYATGFTNVVFATGTDSVPAGQSSNIDGAVPTGCILKYIEVSLAINNAIAAPIFIHTSFMYLLSGQSATDPRAVGGTGSRNQVLHQSLFSLGQDQNNSRVFRFKIPKRFHRMKEGMKWNFGWSTSGSVNAELQGIYKFYQ